ncbi:hypothetical protein [Pseudoxanthomonas suwonensis]|jgi:hypothetical protein|uniref:hypothetical protein n=1 Tax=Pseudoxanthomonas suwonensis TaxID=314722 RepID=UPI000467B643|nr:hypothetical protein [Pseudoxanthomonas suwonensis]
MNLKRSLLPFLLLAAVAGCARREEEPAADTADAQAPAETAAPPKVVADVRAEIGLSPAAEAQLKAQGDRILVEAIFAGDPTPEAQSQTNELGLVELGKTSKAIPGAGPVEFDKSSIDDSRLELIIGQPQVILNVRSEKGLVVCPMFWDSVKSAAEKIAQITCTLPGEAAQ